MAETLPALQQAPGADIQTLSHAGPDRREIACFVAGLVVLVAVQLTVARAHYLFKRHFWADELTTYTIAADRDIWHSIEAQRDGVDTNTPMYYFLVRAFTLPLGGADEVSLRLFALVSVLTGLGGIYFCLRLSYPSLVSFAGMLAVWCHPLVSKHAFEARFYAPWFAATIWFAYLLVRARTSSRLNLKVLLGVCSVLVCTLHYFGIITLVLVTAAELFFRGPVGRARWNGLLAASCGVLPLLACTPFLLGQRSALTVATWIDPPSWYSSQSFLRSLLVPDNVAVLILLLWLANLFGPRRALAEWRESQGDLTLLAGLTGLLLLPLALIVMSYILQPVLVPRYALPAVAALAPAAAFALSRKARGWIVLACVWFVLLNMVSLRELLGQAHKQDNVTAQLAETIRRQTEGDLVAFESSHPLWVLYRYAPDVRNRCFFMNFEPQDLSGAHHSVGLFMRDITRRCAQHYHWPALVSLQSLRARPRFYVVVDTGKWIWLEDAFPDFSVRPLTNNLVALTRKAAGKPTD